MGGLIDGAANALTDVTTTSDEAASIISGVFEPVHIALKQAATVGGLGFGVCLGDFDGTDIVDPDPGEELPVDLCADLPLREDAKWSLIAFSAVFQQVHRERCAPA